MENNQEEKTLTSAGVLDKYKAAGEIANSVLREILSKCMDGADIHDLCKFGNNRIREELDKTYTSKNIEKGPAFPVCISVNQVCCHFCPLKEDSISLKNGDLVKIDLGVHIDCFPVMVAHSMIVGGKSNDSDIENVASAAKECLLGAVKSLAPEVNNYDITKIIGDIANLYNCQPLEGVLSHEIKQYAIDGVRVIISKDTPEHKVDSFKIKPYDIFAIDVTLSSNSEEGKTKESELRTSVFKRNIDATTDIKSKLGRQAYNEIRAKFSDFGFTLNDFEDLIVFLKASQSWD